MLNTAHTLICQLFELTKNTVKKMTKDFPVTPDDMTLYHQSVALYNKTEAESAHIANVNGITVGYLEFGPKDGVPLIWVHSSGSTSYEIFNVQAGLVEAGYRVISIDYRGHGKTQIEITDYNTSLYHIADDIAALMDQLDIDKAIIGGLSKGGWVAAAFYDTYPDRVLGLLLEDGGSFSCIHLAEDIQLKVVNPAPAPYPAEANATLCDTSIRYHNRLSALKAVWAAFSPAVTNVKYTAEYLVAVLAALRQEDDGAWIYHFDASRVMTSNDASRDSGSSFSSTALYSRLPLMQQSQELMNPFVVFRNLRVPIHIIDLDSSWMPVRHQNKALQMLHPDLIVHEIYGYERSLHQMHIERPERFIASAKALLTRVCQTSRGYISLQQITIKE